MTRPARSPYRRPWRSRWIPVLLAVLAAATLGGCATTDDEDPGPPISVPSAPRPITVEWAGNLCSAFRPTFEAIETASAADAQDRQALLARLESVADAVRETDTALTSVGAAPVEEGQPVIERVGARFEDFRAALDVAIASLRAPGGTGVPADAALVLTTFTRQDVVEALAVDDVQEAVAFAPACTAYR
ncbi:hypothetical protein ACL02T_01315 [Pseudonocardia sp. RS010]|uniref:hypothetical protein n=1 Tax=Pseudonocardia sp. RS010 TaxID=3385979 RepID=UPI0039A34E01